MRNLVLTIFIYIFLIFPVFAVDFLPRYNDTIKDYGIGLYFGDGNATVYEKPDEKSPILAKLSWTTEKININEEVMSPAKVFAVFLPNNALSGFIAVDEQGTEYTEIIYNREKNLRGWVKNAPDNKVFYWRQLFYKYGKTKGLYVFANIPKDERYLKLSPEDDADLSYEFIYPKYIRLLLIKGNWALLKVVDFNDEQKTGWFKWRNPDGTLNLFPQFNG